MNATPCGRVYQAKSVDVRMAVNSGDDGAVELLFAAPTGISRAWLLKDFIAPLYRELAMRVEGAALADNVLAFKQPEKTP